MAAIRLPSTTMSAGPYAGAPVPSTIVTSRRISREYGPEPSVRSGAAWFVRAVVTECLRLASHRRGIALRDTAEHIMQQASFGVDCRTFAEDFVPDIPTTAVAVVIIDMQNGFCHPDGSFGQVGADVSGCNAAIAGCVRIVDAARAAGYPVVFTRAIHDRGLTDWRMLTELPMFAGLRAISSCEDGTWDAELVGELKMAPGELEFTKSRYSPFVET